MMLKSTNPVLSRMEDNERILDGTPMTVNGTIGKTFVLLTLATIAAAATVFQGMTGSVDKAMLIMIIGVIAGLILGIVTSFIPKIAKFTAPVYAFAQGAALGGLTFLAEAQFPGIALQAIAGTFGLFFVMLFLFRIGAIRATEKFKAAIMSAIMTILVLYIINIVASLFHITIPFLNGSGPMSILLSVLIVGVAALCLIIDFDFIEQGEKNLLPKDFEWYGAFGLMVTLVWLYVEVLKLITKLRDR